MSTPLSHRIGTQPNTSAAAALRRIIPEPNYLYHAALNYPASGSHSSTPPSRSPRSERPNSPRHAQGHKRPENKRKPPKTSRSSDAGTSSSQAQPANLAPVCCGICLELLDPIPRSPPTARCAHEPTICTPCLENYVSHAVQTEGLSSFSCPNAECAEVMGYEDVCQSVRSNDACLERYKYLLSRHKLEKEPNVVWCKSPLCCSGQVHTAGAEAPLVTCQECSAESCFKHDIPWHTGYTCDQYDELRAQQETQEEAANTVYFTKHVKLCPNEKCRRRIEKADGCDHMTCNYPAGCGHHFCWVCLADYAAILKKGNSYHKPNCRYYMPKEPRSCICM